MPIATYTPAEFAAIFNRERTWAYRLLYSGKVKALTKLGQLQIPQSEVDRLLADTQRYRGSPSHEKRTAKRKAAKKVPVSKGAKKWSAAMKQRKKNGASLPAGDHSDGVRKKASAHNWEVCAGKKKSAWRRLTRGNGNPDPAG